MLRGFSGPTWSFAEMGGFQLHCSNTDAEVQGIDRGKAKLEGADQWLYLNGQGKDAGIQFSCLYTGREQERFRLSGWVTKSDIRIRGICILINRSSHLDLLSPPCSTKGFKPKGEQPRDPRGCVATLSLYCRSGFPLSNYSTLGCGCGSIAEHTYLACVRALAIAQWGEEGGGREEILIYIIEYI